MSVRRGSPNCIHFKEGKCEYTSKAKMCPLWVDNLGMECLFQEPHPMDLSNVSPPPPPKRK